jgi:two-component system, OmpR family, sensor histidine kinase KdpD
VNDLPAPDPDALLKAAQREGRGRLKIFLGAAPGVGKTYEMLGEARARAAAGVDVVAGVVETHGRAETMAMLEGLEQVPQRQIPWQGGTLTEMDIDAILARRPALVLVDELAHSNVPGSRHPKRWQDVEELLGAGIDLFSTLNIQHVESLGDVVASFTRVRVRETVPDRVLEAADIQVVDLPPDELIQRLKDGKVYVPAEASRALAHFFSPANLSALRELALRRAAQSVDAQMLDLVRGLGLPGQWPVAERILVAVSDHPGSEALVRAAKRLADAARAPWTALNVITPASRDADAQARLAATLALVGQLGGDVAHVPAPDILSGIKAHAAQVRATQIIVGKAQRSWWFKLRHGSLVDRLIRETPGIAVNVVPIEGAGPAAGSATSRPVPPAGWGWTLAMVAAATLLGVALRNGLGIANVSLLYMLPVMTAASLFGLRPGLLAGIASALAFNFFFLPPLYTFTIADPENWLAVAVLLGVAVATSQLASRIRAQADLASASARDNAVLAGFLRRLTRIDDDAALAQAIAAEFARQFDCQAMVVGPGAGGPALLAASETDLTLDTMAQAAAGWALERGETAGHGTATLTASDWLFRPLVGAAGPLAVLGLRGEDGRDPLQAGQLPLLAGLIDQAALALDRARLAGDARQLARVEERDRLRATLLQSVAHDLKTPLTIIQAAAAELERGATPALIATVRAEAERLKRFVGNLLDMARVEAGALAVNTEPVDLTDAIAAAVHDTRHVLGDRPIRLDVRPDLPLVQLDPRLFHHMLINLLDNAGRYAAAATPLDITASRRPDGLDLAISDTGPGLAAGSDPFTAFRRLKVSDRVAGGTGLGLAIVKGFADAMGVGVSATNRSDGTGAVFTLHLPDGLLVRAPAEAML